MECAFTVKADNQDITDTIQRRLISLDITDENGITSDSLKLNLHDSDNLQLPRKGVKLYVTVGYAGALIPKGAFTVDKVTLSGPSPTMTITARGANLSRELREPKNRSWHEVTFGELLNRIADEHNMSAKTPENLQSIYIPHTDQTDESDAHFLTRLAAEHNAVLKPNGNYLMLVNIGKNKSSSGRELSMIIIRNTEVTSWRGEIPDRDRYASVVATYTDKAQGKEITVTAGEGKPAWRIRRNFADQETAKAAAESQLKRLNRRNASLHINMPGKPEVAAESPLLITGLRDGFNGKWSAKKVTHRLTSSGMTTAIECEPKEG
ncbi:MAG: phage late control D family protein [Lentisphaerae bacterium]|nr:phage late control D family protein [Lentisphaerota bacterium]